MGMRRCRLQQGDDAQLPGPFGPPWQEVIPLLCYLCSVRWWEGQPCPHEGDMPPPSVSLPWVVWKAVLLPQPSLADAARLMLPVPILLMHAGCWDQMHGARGCAEGYEQGDRNAALLAEGGEERRSGVCAHRFCCPELGLKGAETCGARHLMVYLWLQSTWIQRKLTLP